MGSPACFFFFLQREATFMTFLFSFLRSQNTSKIGAIFQERICSSKEQICSLKRSPKKEWETNYLRLEFTPLEGIPYTSVFVLYVLLSYALYESFTIHILLVSILKHSLYVTILMNFYMFASYETKAVLIPILEIWMLI